MAVHRHIFVCEPPSAVDLCVCRHGKGQVARGSVGRQSFLRSSGHVTEQDFATAHHFSWQAWRNLSYNCLLFSNPLLKLFLISSGVCVCVCVSPPCVLTVSLLQDVKDSRQPRMEVYIEKVNFTALDLALIRSSADPDPSLPKMAAAPSSPGPSLVIRQCQVQILAWLGQV